MAEQEKKEVKKTQDDDMNALIERAVQKALEKAIPASVGIVANIQESIKTDAANRAAEARATANTKCTECGQLTRACKGEHVKMVVYPKDNSLEDWFMGVYVNGVRYISNHSSDEILVPKNNDIASLISQWEQNETESRNGRRKSSRTFLTQK